MARLTQVDLAYKDPETAVKWHSDLLELPFKKVADGMFVIALDGSELHFVEAAASGVPDDAQGIHQFHFNISGDAESIHARCQTLGLDAQLGEFGSKGKAVFLWDLEKNPVVLEPEIQA